MKKQGDSSQSTGIRFDFGTFEGFNFRDQSAIEELLSADGVLNWDHDEQGEAEFWPSGDNESVALLFSGKSSVSSSELLALDELLGEVGDDSIETFLRAYYLVSSGGYNLKDIDADMLMDLGAHIFEGQSFIDLRKEAAYELFELYYPEAYQAWEKCSCDGLIFDVDRFLDSPVWTVEEVILGSGKALIVVPQ